VRTLLGCLMVANAALFLFGAVQHAGVAVGPLREPRILPAAIVEILCALSLAWGTVAVFGHRIRAWRAALITNLVALSGVVLGIAALAAGAGPRTASNDLYHRMMLVLIGAALLVLFTQSGRSALGRS
jgi:hypothetical protein